MKPRVLVIAEAGVNHNGSIEMAKQLVDRAKDAGADIVKFQTFQSKKLVSKTAPKAEYQLDTTSAQESQLQMLQKLELSERDHDTLIDYCRKRGIEFLSTPFDLPSVELLTRLDLSRFKIPSGEITNAPLVLAIARTRKPVIVSTGMCDLQDVGNALSVIAFGLTEASEKPSLAAFERAYDSPAGKKALREKVTILHCTTEYPAPLDEVNLNVMDTLRREFGLPVGYSDHTAGIAVPIAAVAKGATVIEKHFTLDRALPGPDHQASLEPDELTAMVHGIRSVELALGNSAKQPTASESKNRAIARKSLVAAHPIKKGEIFTQENLTAKRPGTGISPMQYWEWLGRAAPRDFQEDEVIAP